MKIIAKINDLWHTVSNVYGADNKVVYHQKSKVSELDTTIYWQLYRRAAYQIGEGKVQYTALVLIGDYCYPVTVFTDTFLRDTDFTDNASLWKYRSISFAKYKDEWPHRVFGDRHVLEDKMPNPIPSVKFGILFLARSINVLWEDPVINLMPKGNNFYDLFPPELVWQEISMSLAKDNEVPVVVDDVVKLQQAGFDAKTSFRGKR